MCDHKSFRFFCLPASCMFYQMYVQLSLRCIHAILRLTCLPVHYFLCVFVFQDCEVLDAESKRFEDLEFQQLEKESRQDEEKETHTQQLLREIADFQRSTVTRKVSTVCLSVCFESSLWKYVYCTISCFIYNPE